MLARKSKRREEVDVVRLVVGSPITALYRHVFALDRTHDEYGHGITEVRTEAGTLTLGIGPNEEGIVLMPRSVGALDPTQWATVVADREGSWARWVGRSIRYVDVFGDGSHDVAYVFHGGGDTFSVVLLGTDLRMARALELFRAGGSRDLPRFRVRIP